MGIVHRRWARRAMLLCGPVAPPPRPRTHRGDPGPVGQRPGGPCRVRISASRTLLEHAAAVELREAFRSTGPAVAAFSSSLAKSPAALKQAHRSRSLRDAIALGQIDQKVIAARISLPSTKVNGVGPDLTALSTITPKRTEPRPETPIRPVHATSRYSWNRPPSLSVRRSRARIGIGDPRWRPPHRKQSLLTKGTVRTCRLS